MALEKNLKGIKGATAHGVDSVLCIGKTRTSLKVIVEAVLDFLQLKRMAGLGGRVS